MEIKFDKYDRMGAFSWTAAEKDPFYRARITTIVRYLKPKMRCLDLGCGDGAYLGAAARKAKEIIGVESLPVAVKLAEGELSRRKMSNVSVICADIRNIIPKIEASSFDLVWSMDVIEHMEKPEPLLVAAAHAMKSHARFLLGTPLFSGAQYVSPYHVHEYTLDELEKTVSGLFTVEDIKRLPDKLKNQAEPPKLRKAKESPDRFAVLVLSKKQS